MYRVENVFQELFIDKKMTAITETTTRIMESQGTRWCAWNVLRVVIGIAILMAAIASRIVVKDISYVFQFAISKLKEKIMKKLQVMLYVASIAVAVGIGMGQVGKSSFEINGADTKPACSAKAILSLPCKTEEPNKSDANCSSTATMDSEEIMTGQNTILVGTREGSSLCGGCKTNYTALENKKPEGGCTPN